MESQSASEVVVYPTGARTRIRSLLPSLPEAERVVADFILATPEEMIRLPVRALATRIGVSEATITRCCQSLGYSGLRELKLALATEAGTPLHGTHTAIAPDDDTLTIAEKVLRSDLQAIADTIAVLDGAALEAAVQALLHAPRVEFYGVGSSIPVVLDAYVRFLRIGITTAAITDAYAQIVAASQLPEGAVAFGISHSGRSPETLNALKTARAVGATTILLTSHAGSAISAHADIQLVTAGREIGHHVESIARRIVHLSIIDALCAAVALNQPERTMDALQRTRRARAEKIR